MADLREGWKDLFSAPFVSAGAMTESTQTVPNSIKGFLIFFPFPELEIESF